MNVFGEGHGHGVAAHTGNGGQEVAEDAESQQQLDGELDKERVGKRVVENLQVAVHHHQAGGKQQPDHPRHHFHRPCGKRPFRFAPRLAADFFGVQY